MIIITFLVFFYLYSAVAKNVNNAIKMILYHREKLTLDNTYKLIF